MKKLVVITFAIFFVTRLHAADDPPAPAITFAPAAVTVSGIAPRSSVLLFGVSADLQNNWRRVIVKDQILVDDDRDGIVKMPISNGSVINTVWLAVDMSSGAYALASPQTRAPVVRAFVVAKQDAAALQIGAARAEGVLVRPGAGAWRLSAGDGADGDLGPKDDLKIDSSLTFMTPVSATGPPPPQFRKDDLLVVIDRMTFATTVVVIGKEKN
jgi:hypothetical protein